MYVEGCHRESGENCTEGHEQQDQWSEQNVEKHKFEVRVELNAGSTLIIVY